MGDTAAAKRRQRVVPLRVVAVGMALCAAACIAYAPARVFALGVPLTLLMGGVAAGLLARLRSAAALRLHRQLLASVVADASDAILLRSLDGTLLNWNGAAEKLFQHTATQALGRQLVDLIVPADRVAEELALIERCRAGQHVASFDTIRLRRDGGELDVSITASPVGEPSGEVAAIATTIRDISLAKAHERKLQLDVAVLEYAASSSAEKLKATEHTLVCITDALPSMIGYWDAGLVNRFANLAYQRWFGIDAGAIRGMCMRDLLGEELFARNLPSIQAALRGERVIFERELPDLRSGRATTQLVHYLPDVEQSVVKGFYVMVNDVTLLKAAQQLLVESEAKFRSLFELSPVGIALNDLGTGQFLHTNESLAAPTGYSAAELAGMTYWDLTPTQYREGEDRQLKDLRESHRYGPYEKEYRRKDGSTYPVLLSGIRLRDASGRSVIWSIVQDISERKAMESRLAEAARTDKLTGLANRAQFMERLEGAVARVAGGSQELFAVLFLDFDRFKMINDTLGHESGDSLLRQIAQRLRAELRASDTLSADDGGNVVSRFGGDEFLVLINDLQAPQDAPNVAERLLNALAPAYHIDGSEVHSTASIGIVTSDQCHGSAEEVVRNADVAMYEAKHAGRACSVVFNEAMHTRLTRHVAIENSLRHAIGTSDMYLVYQPIVDIETGRVVSVEALIRWTHPVLGVITPTEFIPIAEESNLIVALGQWVQREACRAMMSWRTEDPGLAPRTISVNISRAELALGNRLIEQVRGTLTELGLPAHCLQLEVTEREVMRHPEAAHAALHALQSLGIQLAMDDFGTGTSSLGFLRNYPFNTIKIDRSFIQDVTSSPDVLAVIHATINLVENLGMVSLAEGVEDGAQLAMLQSLGCRYAQGYFLSRPVLAEAFLTAVRTRQSVREVGHC